MNDNTIPTGSLLSQTRQFTQSVRGNPSVIQQQQQPITGTLKSTKTQVDNRRGNVK